jgi:hypothetical protein
MSIKIAAMAARLFMGGVTTDAERKATAASGLDIDENFAKKTTYEKDDLVFATEEMAAAYVIAVGVDKADPRALAVFQAGQKAGRISDTGEYTGPSTSTDGDIDDEGTVAGLPKGTQTAKDPKGGGNGCGQNTCGGLTALSRGRLGEEGMDSELKALEAALAEEDEDEEA